jgi:hypothetical protein
LAQSSFGAFDLVQKLCEMKVKIKEIEERGEAKLYAGVALLSVSVAVNPCLELALFDFTSSSLHSTNQTLSQHKYRCFLLLPIIGSTSGGPTYLLTYAAPVTRKMLHFSDLSFYSVPTLPAGWQAPIWLKLELGFYAGSLYFEFSEYQAILEFLGIRYMEGRVEMPEDADDDNTDNIEAHAVEAPKMFTHRPLTFIQEWLAIRRKGQNFDQTPMGFVCQGRRSWKLTIS